MISCNRKIYKFFSMFQPFVCFCARYNIIVTFGGIKLLQHIIYLSIFVWNLNQILLTPTSHQIPLWGQQTILTLNVSCSSKPSTISVTFKVCWHQMTFFKYNMFFYVTASGGLYFIIFFITIHSP